MWALNLVEGCLDAKTTILIAQHKKQGTQKMRFRLLAFVTTLIIGAPTWADEESVPPTTDALLEHPEVIGALSIIDAWIEGRHTFEQIPGISVGIVRDQDLLWSKGYGVGNRESKRAVDNDTLYSICSISKLFTAIGVMQLRDAGALRLRDAVGDHLDWFDIEQVHQDRGPVTIEGLMTHSSGLPRESDFPYWIGPEFPFPSREQMIDRLALQETLYPSHEYFQYSNLGWSLAGEIVAERSGEDYDDYIQSNILDPLKLTNTRTHFPEELHGEELAIGYTGMHRDLKRDPVKPFFTRGITAAAGFTSSVNDLARFASWQFRLLEHGGDEVLDANTLREMHRVHWVDPDWETTWGLGFNVRRANDTTYVSHGGGCPGYITSFMMVPDQKIAAVVLTNAGDGPASGMAVNILNTIGPALKKATNPPEDETPDFSMYEGNYESRPWGGEVAVRQWGDKLVLIDIPRNNLQEAMISLEHDSDHTFLRLDDNDNVREPWLFEIGTDGHAVRIKRHSGYMTRID
jgi:CubicO group peptidase (beta-lactamase class C family)